MQLRRLRVKNIRSYEAAEVEFGDGTTLIAGDVGSGKTSLLYAIEMALFGVAEVNGAYLVRHGAGHAEVAVAFEGPDQQYEISRRFRRLRRKGQETFEADRIRFTVNGAETAYSATELRQRVIELLGFPDNPSPQAHSDLWRWAVYVPQERMRDILGARPQDRLETVRKALGVERYRTAAENAQELAADLRRSAATRRAEADRLRHYEEQFELGGLQIERLTAERGRTEQSLREHEAAFSVVEAARADVESQVRRAEADERELASLGREQKADRAAIEEQLRSLAEQKVELARLQAEGLSLSAEANALATRRETLATVTRELARLREEEEKLASRLRSLAEARVLLQTAEREEANARAALEQRRGEADEARRASEEALTEEPAKEPSAPSPETLGTLDERLTVARAREATCLQAVAQAESALSEVEELLRVGVCPRCHQPVRPSEFETHRAEAAAIVTSARTRLAVAETEVGRIEEERKARERYERALERWAEVEKRRVATRAAHERATVAVQEAVRVRETAATSASAARARVTELTPEEARESALRDERARAEREEAERSREVEQSVLAAERRRGIDRAIEAGNDQSSRLEREGANLQGRVTDRERRIETLRSTAAELEGARRAAQEAHQRIRSAQRELDADRRALGNLESQLEEAGRRVREAELRRGERAELLGEAADIEEKASWIGTAFRATLLGMEQKLLTHAQALFEREFARYFASLIDDPALIARTDPAFTPLVMIEGEWTPAEALSGGERTSLALAFRLALAHVVRSMGSLRLDTILLDEPTDGFSPEQVVRMGELFEELALPQVILVSHESQLAAIADKVVRVQKVDGKSVLGDNGALGRGPAGAPEPPPEDPHE